MTKEQLSQLLEEIDKLATELENSDNNDTYDTLAMVENNML